MDLTNDLSRRERQIMQVVFEKGSATAKQIVAKISDPPSRTAIRTILTILVDKKCLTHTRVGREYVYKPTTSRKKASRGALQNVLRTFFGGSIENLVASHFADPTAELDELTLKRMEQMIKDARDRESKIENSQP